MKIEISINELRDIVDWAENAQVDDLREGREEEYPPDDDGDAFCEDESLDSPVEINAQHWDRARELAGLKNPPRRRDFVISPDKVADIDVYIRCANELGEFGPKFLRDRWQEIKAMYAVYQDEGVPGRKAAPLNTTEATAGVVDNNEILT